MNTKPLPFMVEQFPINTPNPILMGARHYVIERTYPTEEEYKDIHGTFPTKNDYIYRPTPRRDAAENSIPLFEAEIDFSKLVPTHYYKKTLWQKTQEIWRGLVRDFKNSSLMASYNQWRKQKRDKILAQGLSFHRVH